jgi:heme oxygenase
MILIVVDHSVVKTEPTKELKTQRVPNFIACARKEQPIKACHLRERLKTETLRIHQQLESDSLLAELVSPTISRQTYAAILQKQHLFYRTVEPQLTELLSPCFDVHLKTEWLESDLGAMNVAPLPDRPLDFFINSIDTAVGVLYVLEGSTLGAQLIVRNLKQSLREQPRRFFEGYGSETGMMWRNFISFLREIEPVVSADAVVEGAQRTFAFFDNWFNNEIAEQ